MSTHELKTWPDAYQAIEAGRKKHEVREDDRGYAVGDVLVLREFVPCTRCCGTGRAWDNGDKINCWLCGQDHGTYTGHRMQVRVTYMTKGGICGLPEGLCVMSIEAV